MIPLRISVRNFMCYREPAEVLDLEGVHLACLSGENGAGKSALLEAMTWSLWGRARDRQMDDELMAQGATEMEVDFCFLLSDSQYRVIRKRARKGASSTPMLDLMVSPDGEEGTWRPLSGATVRETQSRINDELKIDYETFINSAFILQGRADEFTIKTATERKRVLANLLGLDQYDRLEEQAKDEAKSRKVLLNELDYRIKEVEAKVQRRPELVIHLEELGSSLSEARAELKVARALAKESDEKRKAAERAQSQIEKLTSQLQRLERDMDAARQRIARNSGLRQELERLVARKEAITGSYDALQIAAAEDERLGEMRDKVAEITDRRNAVAQSISFQENRLGAGLEHARKNSTDLSSRLASRPIVERDLLIARENVAEMERLQAEHEDARCQNENLDVQMRAVTRELADLKSEGASTRQKLNLILDAHESNPGHSGCPLCGTPLTDDALLRVRRSYEDEIREKLEAYKTKESEQTHINEEMRRIAGELTRLRETLRPLESAPRKVAELTAALQNLDRDEIALAQATEEIDRLTLVLSDNEYALDERKALAAIETEFSNLAYDKNSHDSIHRNVIELRVQGAERDYHALASAARDMESLSQSLEEDTQKVASGESDIESYNAELRELQPHIDGLAEIVAAADAREQEVVEWDGRVDSLVQERGSLQAQLDECDRQQEVKSTLILQYNNSQDEKSAFDDLANAFGKKGIQAMIIESALPEVEDDANALLGKMTDGRMTVAFPTQKDAKSNKSVIETLDINISDEIGTRPYELYSGGEAFRVNLAVRIALSKLLARRAGTRLQTLVIDEGFGSQDGQGREKLVGAIHSIQNDFDRILVITHIDELKDEFPVRIDIVKTPTGSRILMSGSD